MIADSVAAADSAKPTRPVRSAPIFAAGARAALSIAAQTAVLWSIDLVASAAVARFHAPVPGNVLGLALLSALLCSGIVKATWLEPAATLLVKHLAFFFIPVTVGLMGMGSLFALHGVVFSRPSRSAQPSGWRCAASLLSACRTRRTRETPH